MASELAATFDQALDLRRHAEDLRHSWQGRVLAAAQGRVMLAVTSMLAHAFDEAMPTLMRVVQPKCWDQSRLSLKAPFFTSLAKVNKQGRVCVDAIMGEGRLPSKDVVIFHDTKDFETEMRKLADKLKLSDTERQQFFTVAKNWIAADRRLDPTMNPQDPDAKRLVS